MDEKKQLGQNFDVVLWEEDTSDTRVRVEPEKQEDGSIIYRVFNDKTLARYIDKLVKSSHRFAVRVALNMDDPRRDGIMHLVEERQMAIAGCLAQDLDRVRSSEVLREDKIVATLLSYLSSDTVIKLRNILGWKKCPPKLPGTDRRLDAEA